MKTIEIKESNVKSLDKFEDSLYPTKGMYINTDENGVVDVLFATDNSGVWVLPIISEIIPHIIDTTDLEVKTEDTTIHKVTESFALKMLSIGIRKSHKDFEL